MNSSTLKKMNETIFKKNMLVIITRGRMASAKALILDKLEDGRFLVAGYIRRKNRKFSKNKGARMFIKKMNILHLIATSYSIEFDFEIEDKEKVFSDPKLKREVLEKIENLLESKNETPGNIWMKEKLVIN